MAKHVQPGPMRSRGFTVTELLVVVIIVAILAVVAVPSIRSSDPHKLDYAATRVADAIRIARAEAIRTGDVWGARVNQNNQRVRVRRYDRSNGDPFETLYHPVDRQPLDFDFDTFPMTAGVRVTNATDAFDYPGLGDRKQVLFDGQGVPFWVESGGQVYRLGSGSVELSLDGQQRFVQVEPITGRVTVQ